MKLLQLTVICLLFSTTLAAQSAKATIELQKGIAGVVLDMTKQQVTDLLGEPTTTNESGEAEVDPGIQTDMIYPDKLTVTFFQNTPGVYAVTTKSKSEKTSSGVGVGSSERALKKKISGIKCRGSRSKGSRSCTLGKVQVGKRNTEFQLKKNAVTSVTVRIQTP